MDTPQLMDALTLHGLTVRVDDEGLLWIGPRKYITADLAAGIAACRDELLLFVLGRAVQAGGTCTLFDVTLADYEAARSEQWEETA